MNLAEKTDQPANPQDDYPNLFIEIRQSLYRLHVLLIRTFSSTFLQASSSMQHERLSRLDWENSRQQDNKTVAIIYKRLKEKLQEESFHGRETWTLQLLKEVFSHLWKYVLFNQGTERAMPLRQHHDQESLNYRRISEDCGAVVQTIQQLSGIHQKELFEGSSNLNQALSRILCYLKQTLVRQSQPQTTSYDEDTVFEELDWILR